MSACEAPAACLSPSSLKKKKRERTRMRELGRLDPVNSRVAQQQEKATAPPADKKNNHQILLLEYFSPPCGNRERQKLKTNEKRLHAMSRSCPCCQQPLFKYIFCVTVHFQPPSSMCYFTQQLQTAHLQQLQLDLIEHVLVLH